MPVPAEAAAVVTTSGSNPTEGIKKLKIKVKSKSFPHLKEVVEIATKPLSHLLGTDFSFFEIIEKNLRINNRLSIICCIFVTIKNKLLNKNSAIYYKCKIKSFF